MNNWRMVVLAAATLTTMSLRTATAADPVKKPAVVPEAIKTGSPSPVGTESSGKAVLAQAGEKPAPARLDAAALEADFSKKLTGAALVGTFSIQGREVAKQERYEIASATKLVGNDWLITARIKYGDKDLSLPVPVKVYWADDTPVISLTNLTLPGLGTFTSRVMIYGDRYAGTWQHDAVGGHMWGMVEKVPAKPESDSPSAKPAAGSKSGQ